ncbi:hypothetical protein [Paraburkholderia sp. J63]|uniref:hypothetical protein n=1 Tax=Paraburkholderia sp. J63 TaxID=2805434 RepID=UPI0039F62391
MSTPPEVLTIRQAVKGILDDMRSPKLDPDKTLNELKGKLKTARLTNNALKNVTDSSGVPLEKYGGSETLEELVEKNCAKPAGFFKKQRSDAESKKIALSVTAPSFATMLMSPASISLCLTMAAYTFLRNARLAARISLAVIPCDAAAAVAGSDARANDPVKLRRRRVASRAAVSTSQIARSAPA